MTGLGWKRRSSRRWATPMFVLVGVVCLIAQLPRLSLAQEAPDPEPRSRVLNGHAFIPSTRLYDPFITTSVRQTTGIGMAQDVVTVVEDLEGNPISFTGNVTFLGIGFGYQQALADWLAAYITLGGGGRIGTDAEAILSTGLNAFVDFTLGGKAKVWSNRRFLISASLDFANTGVSGVNVLNWAREVVESGVLTDSSLVVTGSTGSFRGGLNLSYAPAPWLGLSGVALFGLGNAVGDLESEFAFQGQIYGDVDLDPIARVPVGFILGYDGSTFAQHGGDITDAIDAFIFGVFYTGREDFSIGLEFQNAKLPLKAVDSSIRTSEVSINLRYFF